MRDSIPRAGIVRKRTSQKKQDHPKHRPAWALSMWRVASVWWAKFLPTLRLGVCTSFCLSTLASLLLLNYTLFFLPPRPPATFFAPLSVFPGKGEIEEEEARAIRLALGYGDMVSPESSRESSPARSARRRRDSAGSAANGSSGVAGSLRREGRVPARGGRAGGGSVSSPALGLLAGGGGARGRRGLGAREAAAAAAAERLQRWRERRGGGGGDGTASASGDDGDGVENRLLPNELRQLQREAGRDGTGGRGAVCSSYIRSIIFIYTYSFSLKGPLPPPHAAPFI